MKPTTLHEKIIKTCLYLLVVLVPILFTPIVHTVFSAPKIFSLKILVIIALAFWGMKIHIEEKIQYQKTPLNIFLLIYGAVCLVTTILSINIYTSIYGGQGRFIGLITTLMLLAIPFFIVNFLSKKEELISLLKVSFIISFFLSIYGIIQYHGFFQENFNWTQDPNERVFGTLGHGTHFGAYLGMHIVLGLFIFPEIKKKTGKLIWAGAIISQCVTLFLTGGRSALLAVVVSVLLGIALILKRHKEVVKRKYAKFLPAIFIIISITLAGSYLYSENLRELPMINRTIKTVENIQSGHIPDRVSWWLSGIQMIQDKPFLGHGFSAWRDAFNQYRRLDYQTPEPGDMENHITPEAAHNEYINIAATQGIIGLLSFLALIGFVFWQINKTIFPDAEEKLFYPLLGVKCAIAVYLMHIILSFGVVGTLVPFYVFLGVGVALSKDNRAKNEIKISGIALWALIIFITAITVIGTTHAIRELLAEYYYKQGEIAYAGKNIEKAVDNFEIMTAMQPRQYAYFQTFGDFALKAGADTTLDIAVKHNLNELAVLNYNKALGLNTTHPSTYYNSGVAEFQKFVLTTDELFYFKGAEKLQKSIEMAVNNPYYPYQAGKAYMSIPRADAKISALSAFEEAVKIRSPYRDSEELIQQLNNLISPPETSPKL